MKVDLTCHVADLIVDVATYEQLLLAVGQRFGLAEAQVAVSILDDAEMTRLNIQYKDLHQTTDCFSFDLSEGQGPPHFELLVNGELAQREAAGRGHSVAAELALYLVHGLLHQLGFNDTTAAEAEKMHACEDEILQQFGYGVVYNRAKSEGED